MRLTQLRYFCEVCRCGSVTRASENLHVSQPSVSIGIRELEEGYGMNLFYREKKRLVLTEEGEFFYQKALEILDMVNDLDRKMNQLAQKETPLLIGVPPMISIFLFSPLINRFYRQYPDAHVEMREHGTLDAEKLVESEQLDLAITILESQTEEKFNVLRLAESELLFCVSGHHPLAGRSSVRITELKNEKLILMKSSSYQSAAIISRRFEEVGLRPDVLLHSNQLELIRQYIADYDAGAFLMAQLLHKKDEIVGIPLEPAIQMEIGLIWKKGKSLGSQALTFLRFLAEQTGPKDVNY